MVLPEKNLSSPPPAPAPATDLAPAPSTSLVSAASAGVNSLDSLAAACGVSKAELATWDLDDIKEVLKDEHKCTVPVRKKIEVRCLCTLRSSLGADRAWFRSAGGVAELPQRWATLTLVVNQRKSESLWSYLTCIPPLGQLLEPL